MNIYFIRHGETQSNKENRVQGANDPLTEKGIAQAHTLAERLKDTQLDALFSSPLPRASQTADIISKQFSLPVVTVDILTERKNPSKLIGLHAKDEQVLEVNAIRKKEHETNKDWKYDDEENFSELKSRAQEILKFISSQSHENILIVTHGGILRFLLSVMIFGDKLDYETYHRISKSFYLYNTSISQCKYKPATDTKAERWRIVSWNDQSHLEPDSDESQE